MQFSKTKMHAWFGLIVLCLIVPFVSSTALFENVNEFCGKVPSTNTIYQYTRTASGCNNAPKTYTRPLEKLRECCDLQTSEAKRCLQDLARKDRLLNQAYLQWKEPVSNQDMIEQLNRCKSDFNKLAVDDCDYLKGCTDPITHFTNGCTNQVTPECEDTVSRKITTGSYWNICTNNYTSSAGYSEVPETVNLRCMKTSGALSRQSQALNDIAADVNRYCIYKKYGVDVTLSSFLQVQNVKKLTSSYVTINYYMNMEKGVEDVTRQAALDYLPMLCANGSPTSASRRCIATSVTMNHVNFKDINDITNDVNKCCNDPENKRSNDSLIDCLNEAGIFADFYPTTSNYFRGIIRDKTHTEHECMSEVSLKKGTTNYYERDMPTSERLTYIDKVNAFTYTEDYRNKFDQPGFQISPDSYLFFLRNFTGNWASDACGACAVGENLGKLAYSFPAKMCPSLVYKNYYAPLKESKTCPKDVFYKVQVAHYCCLYTAFDRYNFDNFNPDICPDVSDVEKQIVV